MAENNTDKQRIVELVRAFISGPDRGLGIAGEIETSLDSVFPDNSEIQDLVISLASYRPEGGPHLYNQTEMISLLERELPTIERLATENS